MLSLLPGRLLFEQGFGTWTRPLTDLDSSEITATIAEVREFVNRSTESDTKKAYIHSLIDIIVELTDKIAATEQVKENTAALPFKQEIAAPLEELEDLINEMKGKNNECTQQLYK